MLWIRVTRVLAIEGTMAPITAPIGEMKLKPAWATW